jgi:hypothetical protein
LHYEQGYGEDRISRKLPIGHTTASRWIGIFASENEEKLVPMRKSKPQTHVSAAAPQDKEVKFLQAEISRLQSHLKAEKLRADAYDELIKVAESKYKISIRKKAGAKQ